MSRRSSDPASPIFRRSSSKMSHVQTGGRGAPSGRVLAAAAIVTRGRSPAVSKSRSPCCMGGKSSWSTGAISVRSPCRRSGGARSRSFPGLGIRRNGRRQTRLTLSSKRSSKTRREPGPPANMLAAVTCRRSLNLRSARICRHIGANLGARALVATGSGIWDLHHSVARHRILSVGSSDCGFSPRPTTENPSRS